MQCGDDPEDAVRFLGLADRLVAGPRRLAADVEQVGAVSHHSPGQVDGEHHVIAGLAG